IRGAVSLDICSPRARQFIPRVGRNMRQPPRMKFANMDRNETASRLRRMLEVRPWSAWFKGKDFTEDWSSPNFASSTKILSPLRETALDVLEIGSFEGRSTIFWFEFLPKSKPPCVQNFRTA